MKLLSRQGWRRQSEMPKGTEITEIIRLDRPGRHRLLVRLPENIKTLAVVAIGHRHDTVPNLIPLPLGKESLVEVTTQESHTYVYVGVTGATIETIHGQDPRRRRPMAYSSLVGAKLKSQTVNEILVRLRWSSGSVLRLTHALIGPKLSNQQQSTVVEGYFRARGRFQDDDRTAIDARNGEPAQSARFRECRRLPEVLGRNVCLFVSYAKDPLFPTHAKHYMRELRRCGYLVYGLIATDHFDTCIEDPGKSICDGLAIRENIGFDFAVWAAAIGHRPDLLQASALVFANDSVVGPIRPLDDLIYRVNSSGYDVVGLVESWQSIYHLQSFFIQFNERALKSSELRGFLEDVRSFKRKSDVIAAYELTLTAILSGAGLSCGAMFPRRFNLHKQINPTIARWRQLLKVGFPFVKKQLLTENPNNDDLTDLPQIILNHGTKAYIELCFRFKDGTHARQ